METHSFDADYINFELKATILSWQIWAEYEGMSAEI